MLTHRTIWTDHRVIDVLQIEHPIVLLPMAGIGTIEIAAAVSATGGLGSIGCAVMEPEFAAKAIRALRGLTGKPINVNFFCHVWLEECGASPQISPKLEASRFRQYIGQEFILGYCSTRRGIASSRSSKKGSMCELPTSLTLDPSY
jgi:NAD(P)H-dependent flavin oxidoreductase YrpB (nitropropane dioxygenase family)